MTQLGASATICETNCSQNAMSANGNTNENARKLNSVVRSYGSGRIRQTDYGSGRTSGTLPPPKRPGKFGAIVQAA